MVARSLPVLLQIIDSEPQDPIISDRIVEAFQAGAITSAEARHLQSFEKRSPKSRAAALKEQVDVSAEAIAKARAQLKAVSAEFHARHPHLRQDDDA